MASFYIGQRVRIVSSRAHHPEFVGRDAVVEAADSYRPDYYRLTVSGAGPANSLDGLYGAHRDQLAPLTDPRASEFIADMERFSIAAKKVSA